MDGIENKGREGDHMRLQHVKPGQRFMLLRNARRHTCHGPHPKSPYHVLTEPNQGQWPLKSLHISCQVTLLSEETAGDSSMSYKPKADLNHNQHIDPSHRYACKDRPRPGDPWLPVDCGHTWNSTDPSCTGCKWRGA